VNKSDIFSRPMASPPYKTTLLPLHKFDGQLQTINPKIPCVYFVVFNIVGRINFSKNKSMRIQRNNCRILKLPVVDQPQKIATPHSMESRRL
jgi:hypothetical protein